MIDNRSFQDIDIFSLHRASKSFTVHRSMFGVSNRWLRGLLVAGIQYIEDAVAISRSD
jgi:hypothetical protein